MPVACRTNGSSWALCQAQIGGSFQRHAALGSTSTSGALQCVGFGGDQLTLAINPGHPCMLAGLLHPRWPGLGRWTPAGRVSSSGVVNGWTQWGAMLRLPTARPPAPATTTCPPPSPPPAVHWRTAEGPPSIITSSDQPVSARGNNKGAQVPHSRCSSRPGRRRHHPGMAVGVLRQRWWWHDHLQARFKCESHTLP